MKTCSTPIPWERLVDYWAGDLDQVVTDAVEEHLFACDVCSRDSERIARMVQAIRAQIPVTITSADVAALRGRGVRIEENAFAPGVRQEVAFGAGVDLLVHRLGGLDLSAAERVHLTVAVESSGEVIFEEPFASFDAGRGEVLIACQRHFATFPPDIVFDVRAIGAKGPPTTARFLVPHVFG